MKTINIFYGEPDPDRWFPFDRYFRKIVRRIVRGKPHVGGVQKWFVNLFLGLTILKIQFKVNKFNKINKNKELACVIGKPFLLDKFDVDVPIIFGPGLGSHPSETPNLFTKNIKTIIVSCDWMKLLYETEIKNIPIQVWAAGIETEIWKPATNNQRIEVLIYNKIRWEYEKYNESLLLPIIEFLNKKKISFKIIRYGHYKELDFFNLSKEIKSMIFLCEHETQGFAYQQILSTNIPIFAWDRGGFWQDPSYYPHKVKYEPVSSVPYWDERCGMKFRDYLEFELTFDTFYNKVKQNDFSPREYILENLTLEKCAQKYLDIVNSVTP